MRVSDEELQEMVQQDGCQDNGCKRCNAIRDLRDLREAAGPFVEWNNCMESDIDHRWIKVTAQEHDALRDALEAKP